MEPKIIKILHTSDWHLGRSLYGRKRYDEFSQFLDWLITVIEKECIDVLLIAGDIFDTSTPSNRAQELYYRFLCRVSTSCCHHVVVIAGNHDSPSFLNAPKELLRALNVHVTGAVTEAPGDEVLVLCNGERPEVIVCAVPYLRDKDIRTVEPGESIDDKNVKLSKGLKNHYDTVCAIAMEKRLMLEEAGYRGIPLIAMGHLFTSGGKTIEGDGVRELYVGSLAHIGQDAFPSSIDYLALGHLHVPQRVGTVERIRYCGSPIPMGYGEADQRKQVVLVAFDGSIPIIRGVQVPSFQQLVRIVGPLETILAKIEQLRQDQSRAWLEVEYSGSEIAGNLREIIDEAVAGSAMEVLRIKNRRVLERVIRAVTDEETLDDLKISDVFARCLETFNVPEEYREELTASYNEIIQSLDEEDVNAE